MSSNNKKILFLIFSPLFTKGGHSKNFLNLIKHLEKEIAEYKFIPYIISYNNNSKEKADNINKISAFHFFSSYNVRIFRRIFPSGKIIYQLSEFILNFIRTTLFILINRPDIVYAYSDKTLYLAAPLKKFFKFRLIYDMRGDTFNELKAQGASNRYISRLSKTHSKSLESVDIVFTVTDFNNLNSEVKSIPKYNYYDGDIFKYDETRMIDKKKELNLIDKFIFVYTGNAHYYQFLDGNIKFFSRFLKKHSDAFLIIISEYDFNIFREFLNKYNIPDTNYLLKKLPQNEISDLQQTADMGLMLREDLPLNHNAYPTKFAEYLASGVPVLMSPHIHSIAHLVIENNLGEVIEVKDDYSDDIEKIYSKYKNNMSYKKHCSEYAKSELMWQKKSIDIFNHIRNL